MALMVEINGLLLCKKLFNASGTPLGLPLYLDIDGLPQLV